MLTSRNITRGVAIATVAVALLLPRTADAATHRDPNDSASVVDIRAIHTDVTATRVVIEIRTYDRVSRADLRHAGFTMWVDATGTASYDRIIGVSSGRRRLTCEVLTGDTQTRIGKRFARRPSARAIACRLPTTWFDLTRTATYLVEAVENNARVDRAPDHGRYVGL